MDWNRPHVTYSTTVSIVIFMVTYTLPESNSNECGGRRVRSSGRDLLWGRLRAGRTRGRAGRSAVRLPVAFRRRSFRAARQVGDELSDPRSKVVPDLPELDQLSLAGIGQRPVQRANARDDRTRFLRAEPDDQP